MNHDTYDDGYIRTILRSVRTMAIVGASPNTVRPSYFLFKYMLERGYDVIPVNPGQAGKQMLGKPLSLRLPTSAAPWTWWISSARPHTSCRWSTRRCRSAPAAHHLDAARRAQRRGGGEGRGGRPEGRHEPLSEDRIWPPVVGDLVDGHQLAHAELQARACALRAAFSGSRSIAESFSGASTAAADRAAKRD